MAKGKENTETETEEVEREEDKSEDNDNDNDDAGGQTNSLLADILELTELEREDDESAEKFKQRILVWFAEKYPNDEVGNAAYDALDASITDWVDEASEVSTKNRAARNKVRLPELDGLPEDEKAKGKGSSKSTSSAAEAKSTKASADGQKHILQKAILNVLKEHGFARVTGREPEDGLIEFHNEKGKKTKVIYIRPATPDQTYISGWRAKEQTEWSSAAKSLSDFFGA